MQHKDNASRPFSWVEINDLVVKGIAEQIRAISSVSGGSWYRFSQLHSKGAYKEYLAQFGFDLRTLSICSNDLRSLIDENLLKRLLRTNGLGSTVHKFFPQVYLSPTGTNPYDQNMGRTNTDLKLANEPMTNSEPPSVKGPEAGPIGEPDQSGDNTERTKAIPKKVEVSGLGDTLRYDDAGANRKQLLDRRVLNAKEGETFTIEEAAIILEISKPTVRRRMHDGDLTKVRKIRGRVTALSVKRLKFQET
jgi:hypothetical protein